MKSYLRRGYSWFRVTFGVLSLGIALFFGGTAQAAPQYNLSCIDCHQMPPLDSSDGSRNPNTGAFKGNHQQHAGGTAASCAKCHGSNVVNYQTGHRDKSIQVTGNINSYIPASVTSGSYNRGFINQTSVPPSPLATCSNVSCHFESTTDNWGVLPASTYSTLGAGSYAVTCGKCHGDAPNDGSHPSATPGNSGYKHGAYYGTGTGSCIKCHSDHTAESAPFAHATSAGKRGLLLGFTTAPNSGGTYSKPGNLNYPNYLPSQTPAGNRNGNCTNIYCHSNGKGGAPNQTATWGGNLNADCTGCHGGKAGSFAVISSGKHKQHMNNAAFLGDNYACGRCHINTVDTTNDQAINATGLSTYHVNGTKNVSFNNGGTPSGTGASLTCSNTLCHSAGKAAAPNQPSAPTWGGGSLDCKGCHGIGGNYGEPSYPSTGGAGANLANTHNSKHIAGPGSCVNCHAGTTANGTSILAGSHHTDGIIDVVINSTYFRGVSQSPPYNGNVGQKYCNNNYCHSDGNGNNPNTTPQWGATLNPDCTGCHGNDATSTSPILSKRHSLHNYSTMGSAVYFQCAECHAKTVSIGNNRQITGTAHVNGYKDYSGARSGKMQLAYGQTTCTTNYCHSSGQENGAVYRNMTGSKAWSGTGRNGCKACHGYGPGAFASTLGEPNYVNVTSATNPARNSHQAHTGFLGINDTTGCATCHRETVDRLIPNKLRSYSSAHLNGKVDISFKVIGNYSGHIDHTTKTCYNTYCHAGSPSTWGGTPKQCDSCHSASGVPVGQRPALPGRHLTHSDTTSIATVYRTTPGNIGGANNYNFQCSSCHQGIDANGPAAGGGGNSAEVFFGYSGMGRKGSYAYDGLIQDGTLYWSNGKCSNLYCHSDGRGGFPNYTSTYWNSPIGTLKSQNCTGCHGGDANQSKVMSSNKHGRHINNSDLGLGNNLRCMECHAKTVAFSSNTTITDKRKHVNKFYDYSGVRAGGSATYSGQTCSATYCHTSGKKGVAGVSEPAAPNWITSGTIGCNGCHGTGNAIGYPDYNTSPVAPGAANANSHIKHLTAGATSPIFNTSDSRGCAACHMTTVNAGVAGKLRDYSSAHLNGQINVKHSTAMVGTGVAYISATKSCAVYCHSNGLSAVNAASFTVNSTASWGGKPKSCAACHGYTSGSGNLIASNAHAYHVGSGSPATTGKVIGCQDCHSATTTNGTAIANGYAYHVDKNVNVKFDGTTLNKDSDTPAYNGQGTYLTAAGSSKAAGSATGSCANVYCHSNGKANGGTLVMSSAAWNGSWSGSKCVNCHGDGNTKSHNTPDVNNAPGGGNANNHVRHVEYKGYSCDYCHVSTTTDTATLPTTLVPGGTHLNRNADVSFNTTFGNNGGGYNGTVGTKQCSNIYCHSDGNGTYKTPKWGDKLNCRGCHNGDVASGIPMATAKHAAHINNSGFLGAGNGFQCGECHARTVAFGNNTAIINQAKHINGYKDYSGVRAGKIATLNSGKCSTNYCHSNGAKTLVYVNMTGAGNNWYSTRTLDCNGCHGSATAPDFAPFYGAPNYANNTTASVARNSHKKHTQGAGLISVSDTRGCVKCHRTTVDASAQNKLRDYSSAHLNGIRNVSFVKLGNYSGHYNAANMTCANTYCHASGSPKWGSASMACTSCHKADTTLPGAHNAHWQTGVAASYTNNSGNVSTTTLYRFACNSCHNGGHANGPAAGGNGNAAEVMFNYTTAGRKGTYTYTGTTSTDGTLQYSSGTCATTYCHSNGKGGNPKVGVSGFNWGSATNGSVLGSGNGCAGCHGGNAASFQPISTGRHAYHINPASTGNTGVLPTGFTCGECHAKTVSTSADRTIINKAVHVNKFRDYSGTKAWKTTYTLGTNTNCANNTYCHTNGKKGIVVQTAASVTWSQTGTWSAGTQCYQCHGTSATVGAPDYTSAGVGAAGANSHAKHASVSGDCVKCHRYTTTDGTSIASGQLHINGSIDVNFSKLNGFTTYTGSYNAALTQKNCSATYCHGGLQTSPSWGGATTCDSCHKANGNAAPTGLPAGHSIHYADTATFGAYTTLPGNMSIGTTYKFACSSCHPRVKTNHANGPVSATQAAQIFFGFSSAGKGGAIYTGGGSSTQDVQGYYYTTNGITNNAPAGGSCNTTYCHSNGNGGPGNATTANSHAYNWNTAQGSTLGCAGCHGGNASSFAPISSGRHKGHMNNPSAAFSNGNFTCDQCHAKTVSGDTTLTNKANHVNKFKDYSGARAFKSGYAGGNTTCATYCHSNGKIGTSAGVYKGYTTWYNKTKPALGCNGCHGTERGGVAAGFPNYTTGNAGLANANSHRRHAGDKGINCSVCHYATTTDGVSIAAGGRHINGNIQNDVVFNGVGGSAAYIAASKSCSNVSCHSATSGATAPQWGAAMNCASCHPMNKLSRGHAFHVYTSASAPVAYLNMTGNHSTSGASTRYNYGCAVCHPLTPAANHGAGSAVILDFRNNAQSGLAVGSLKNRNSNAITAYGQVGTASSGTIGTPGSSVQCLNVYCHSNGYSASPAYATTPDWYTGSFTGDRCANCHGNWPNSTIAGSPTHYNANWLGTGQAGGHAMGIHATKIADSPSFTTLLPAKGVGNNSSHGDPGQATTISCNTCHNLTVTTGANDSSAQCVSCHNGTQAPLKGNASIFDKSRHVNGSVDVQFVSANPFVSKAQIRDASFALNSSSTLWHRNGGYKAGAGSFDTSKQNLNVANPYVSGGNCTTICHFNKPVTWGNAPAATCYSCHNAM
ncbi:MAG TPA: CxxxxCH/CxxCH domain-containing protein [Geobacteraceae bacterium]